MKNTIWFLIAVLFIVAAPKHGDSSEYVKAPDGSYVASSDGTMSEAPDGTWHGGDNLSFTRTPDGAWHGSED